MGDRRSVPDTSGDTLVRLFYTLLYTATFCMAAAWWAQREERVSWSDVIGLKKAMAQAPVDLSGVAPQSKQPPGQSQFGVGFIPPPNNGVVTRPDGWPGGPPPAAPAAPEQAFEGTQRIAQVGNEFILLADVLGPVNEALAKNAGRIPPSQLDQVRTNMIRGRLEQMIETKLVVAELRRKIPAENLKKIEGKIGDQFNEVEVPKAIERSQVKSRSELEDDLRQTGSSIDRERRAFVERMLAMSWVQQNVKYDEEVTHEQMLAYYQEHAKDYDQPGRVRWQHIQVRFDKFPNKQAAYAALAESGNKVLSGAEFATVAKEVSQGWTADKGGNHDWTTQGSLSSDVLNKALFSLPVGQMSPILEDERSFHIIKVLERREAGRTPFTEIQAEVKQKIKQERAADASKKYLAKLKSTTQVWTVFDDHRPLPSDSPSAIYSAVPAANTLR